MGRAHTHTNTHTRQVHGGIQRNTPNTHSLSLSGGIQTHTQKHTHTHTHTHTQPAGASSRQAGSNLLRYHSPSTQPRHPHMPRCPTPSAPLPPLAAARLNARLHARAAPRHACAHALFPGAGQAPTDRPAHSSARR